MRHEFKKKTPMHEVWLLFRNKPLFLPPDVLIRVKRFKFTLHKGGNVCTVRQNCLIANLITAECQTSSHVTAAVKIKAKRNTKDKRFYILLSVFHQVNVTYSPLTDYICSRVKGGGHRCEYICVRGSLITRAGSPLHLTF